METVFLSHDDRLSDCGSEEEEEEVVGLGQREAISTGLPAGVCVWCVCVCVCLHMHVCL